MRILSKARGVESWHFLLVVVLPLSLQHLVTVSRGNSWGSSYAGGTVCRSWVWRAVIRAIAELHTSTWELGLRDGQSN